MNTPSNKLFVSNIKMSDANVNIKTINPIFDRIE